SPGREACSRLCELRTSADRNSTWSGRGRRGNRPVVPVCANATPRRSSSAYGGCARLTGGQDRSRPASGAPPDAPGRADTAGAPDRAPGNPVPGDCLLRTGRHRAGRTGGSSGGGSVPGGVVGVDDRLRDASPVADLPALGLGPGPDGGAAVPPHGCVPVRVGPGAP